MRFVYTGPSWAYQSYPDDTMSTSLAKEWQIPCTNLSNPGQSITQCINRVRQESSNLPVVWIYGDPLGSLYDFGLTAIDYIQRPDWKDVRSDLNRRCLKLINNIGVPVLLIGAHSDIVDCDCSNIQIGHPSWQRWLADSVGVEAPEHCWAADMMHADIHRLPQVNPAPSLVDSIHEMYNFWDALQQHNVFFEVHPNAKGNVEFAKFLKPTVENFLNSL